LIAEQVTKSFGKIDKMLLKVSPKNSTSYSKCSTIYKKLPIVMLRTKVTENLGKMYNKLPKLCLTAEQVTKSFGKIE